jgi:hypothetical protein
MEIFNTAEEVILDIGLNICPLLPMAVSTVERPAEGHPQIWMLGALPSSVLRNVGFEQAPERLRTHSGTWRQNDCVGPLQLTPKYFTRWAKDSADPNNWIASNYMWLNFVDFSIPRIEQVANHFGHGELTQTELTTLILLDHNMGNVSNWMHTNPNVRINVPHIPFAKIRYVYDWARAVASDAVQNRLKEEAYENYQHYLETGEFRKWGVALGTNDMAQWRSYAITAGFNLSGKPVGERHQINIRWSYPLAVWYHYHLLTLLMDGYELIP